MSDRSTKRENGFSLLEMAIALGLGTLVLGAAVQIYTQGVGATWTASQRAEMQQDFRAASDMLTKDLSMAGAGLGNGAAIALPASSSSPVYGCASVSGTNTCYINGGSVAYPTQGTTPYMYGLLPGPQKGPLFGPSSGLSDVVTVVYTDSAFYLDCYAASVASATTVTFTLTTTSQASPNCTNNGATIQAIGNLVNGLTAGDLVLFNISTASTCPAHTTCPSAPESVVAEVTGVSGSTVTFASGDPLNMNQPSATSGNLPYVAGAAALTIPYYSGTATRILAISYYLDTTVSPPRLMRQVSGHTPMPLVDNVVYLQFTYDLFNDANMTAAVQCHNPGAVSDGCLVPGSSTGLLPNQITKINIAHMSMSSMASGSTVLSGTKGGYQGLDLETSVSARNLTYSNNYQCTSNCTSN
ncbi:MAG: prepilin-type N-terminal cleavage/methylation domain-containing protein [Terriglobales bacterium]|jgi:Tfp pilus assembly protein PilW